jgi:hypothetical protein
MAAAPSPSAPALLCDGCGRPADPEHLRTRIVRLERSTRFRPIHIATLLLADAPPARLEDCFYFTGPSGHVRSVPARAFFDDLVEAAGLSREGMDDAARLGEFERRGLFLAECVECPVEPGGDFAALLARLAPTIVRRIQYSYKPRSILLLSAPTAPLIPALEAAGLGHLLLDPSGPLPLPEPSDSASRASFRARLAHLLAASGSPRP